MNTEILPVDLYKANVELQLRITRLLQEGALRWLESVQKSSAEGVAEITAGIEGLQGSANWQSMAMLPAKTFWRAFQHRVNDGQAINQLAIKNQAVIGVLGGSQSTQPLLQAFGQLGAAWAQPASADNGKTGKGA
jgi:hypothetical protein